MNTIEDITTVFKMLLRIPYELTDHTYVYDWTNYPNFEKLPEKAKNQLSSPFIWSLTPGEFEKLRKMLNET